MKFCGESAFITVGVRLEVCSKGVDRNVLTSFVRFAKTKRDGNGWGGNIQNSIESMFGGARHDLVHLVLYPGRGFKSVLKRGGRILTPGVSLPLPRPAQPPSAP